MTKEEGYVYILTNPSFKDDWVKIGKSSRPVNIRSKELDNTAVPLPFEIYATLKTSKYNEVEKHLHKQIDGLSDLRIRQNREFFNIAPEHALDLLIGYKDILDDAEITIYKDNKPIQTEKLDAFVPTAKEPAHDERGKKSAPRFKFSMVGIKVGEYVTFDPLGIEVKVATDDKVEYEGRLYQLSPFTGTFLPEDKRIPSGAYQGPKYFSYKGKNLVEMRKEREKGSK